MAQNIYDDPQFFEAYSQFRRSRLGLAGAAEWPAMQALLPPMSGLRVADLGCGFGWFCRRAREAGAAEVRGFDLSENMLGRARAETRDSAVAYERVDLQTLVLPPNAFDLAYSSLAFHYVEDFRRLIETVHDALVPGGRLVFSVEHPIYMAPSQPDWVSTPDGRKVWPLDSYLCEGRRTTDWLAPGVVKYHRTLGTTLNDLTDAGFTLSRVIEWKPTDADLAAEPSLRQELDRPMFLLIAAARGGA